VVHKTYQVLLTVFLLLLPTACTGRSGPSEQPTSREEPLASLPAPHDTPSSSSTLPTVGATYPYPAPRACRITPMSVHEARQRFPAWWLDGHDLSVGTPIGALYEGENKLYWIWQHPAPHLNLVGVRIDGPPSKGPIIMGGPESGGPSTVTFSAPGCWSLHAEGNDQHLDAVVYVYPWMCRPEGLRSRSTPVASQEPCTPPET